MTTHTENFDSSIVTNSWQEKTSYNCHVWETWCTFSSNANYLRYEDYEVLPGLTVASPFKNQRGKSRWILKESRRGSGLCNVSCERYSNKCFTQIYKAMYGDAMFVSFWGYKYYSGRKLTKTHVVFLELINIYMSIFFQQGLFRLRNRSG